MFGNMPEIYRRIFHAPVNQKAGFLLMDHPDKRLLNEISHGKHLAESGAGEIWGWETPAGKKRWARRVKMLVSHISPDMNILEIGCGTGYFTKELAKTGASVTAIDISPDLLSEAQKNICATNVALKIENAYAMTFPDNTFDSVVGSSVLHHLEIEQAIHEIYRILKPGGKIFFTEPNMLNPQIAMQKNIRYMKKRMGESPDETAFFRWKLEKNLNMHGFSDVKITPFDFLHPGTPEPLISAVEDIAKIFEKLPIIMELAGSLYIRARK